MDSPDRVGGVLAYPVSHRWYPVGISKSEGGVMKKIISIAVAFLLIGCGGGGGGSDSSVAVDWSLPPAVDITGIWDGHYVSNVSVGMNVDVDVRQEGSSFSGTLDGFQLLLIGGKEVYSYTHGDIAGEISDYNIRFTITVTKEGCSGSLNGTGIVDPDPPPTAWGPTTISFSFSGSTTCGGAESGKGELW